jgi:hypothetical protein
MNCPHGRSSGGLELVLKCFYIPADVAPRHLGVIILGETQGASEYECAYDQFCVQELHVFGPNIVVIS